MGDDSDAADTGKIVATLLGYSVILGSLTVKLPMIKNVLACKDPNCLNLSSLYLESLALLCSASYSFRMEAPISTYAELLSVFLQNVVLVFLMWHYAGKSVSFMIVAAGAVAAFQLSLLRLDSALLWAMPLAATTISISGQFPQIMSNFRNKHTGALSIITQTLNVVGAAVRVFTTIQLVNDPKTLAQCIISTTIQLVLFVQIIAMRTNTAKVMAKNAEKKKDD